MTLLTIMNRVCSQASLPTFEEFVPFLSIASNQGRTATELLTHAHEAGEEITRRAEWSNLYGSQAVVTGTSGIALPEDFHRLIQGNAVQRTTGYAPVMPCKSRDVWTVLQNTQSTQPYYFIDNGVMYFAPSLTSAATIRYISKNWITTQGTVSAEGTDTFTKDADTAKFSESLLALGILWRYKRAKALDYADIQAEFEAELAREIAAARGI